MALEKAALARKVAITMLISLYVVALCLVVPALIVVIQSPGKMNPLLDAHGNVLAGSISEKLRVEINGAPMGMIIKSENASHPVLLLVHGGPGFPEYPLTGVYPTGLEKLFTVVWWDQRGGGLSYTGDDSSKTMTTAQFISDTIAVTNYLRARFAQDKVYLMGHSWGSYIAIQAAAKAPELYHAYIGVGQVSNQMESERKAYQYMVGYYQAAGDAQRVQELQAAPIGTMDRMPPAYLKIRDDAMHRAGIGTTHTMRSVVTGLFLPVMMNREYTLTEKVNIWRGKAFASSTVLPEDLYRTDLRRTVTKLNIPAYFFSGIHDYTVNYSMSEAYLKELDAPEKGFYLFQESAHSPIFEEPERVLQIMQQDVLRGRHDLVGPY